MTQDQWESDKLTVRHHIESQEVSPFPAGDHKAHINRRVQRHSKNKTELERAVNGAPSQTGMSAVSHSQSGKYVG